MRPLGFVIQNKNSLNDFLSCHRLIFIFTSDLLVMTKKLCHTKSQNAMRFSYPALAPLAPLAPLAQTQYKIISHD